MRTVIAKMIDLRVSLISLFTFLCLFLSNCADDTVSNLTLSQTGLYTPDVVVTNTVVASSCSMCKYVVPANTNIIDGAALGIQPGDIIGISSTISYGQAPLKFINIVGTATNPVIITNCGGAATIAVASPLAYSVKFENSKYFKFTGGSVDGAFGLKLSGGSTFGITLDKLTTNFEVDHIEVFNVGFAGIMAKTDPSCDDATNRGYFTLRDSKIHHNYVRNTGGEGVYVGNSFYANGVNTPCGIKFPHDVVNMKIYSNIVKNTNWEAIQLGCAVTGAEVYDNIVENYGQSNTAGQNNGIQIGEGTGGKCYNNHIKSGRGNGLIVLGIADNVIFNNIILNAGLSGIFCDDRATIGTGFQFINNTIVNPMQDGIRLYADAPGMNNHLKNNLIANPGSFDVYENDNTARTGQNDSYIYLLSSSVHVHLSNNFMTRASQLADYLNYGNFNPIITTSCAIKNRGTNPTSYGVTFDLRRTSRPYAGGYDIGAVEY